MLNGKLLSKFSRENRPWSTFPWPKRAKKNDATLEGNFSHFFSSNFSYTFDRETRAKRLFRQKFGEFWEEFLRRIHSTLQLLFQAMSTSSQHFLICWNLEQEEEDSEWKRVPKEHAVLSLFEECSFSRVLPSWAFWQASRSSWRLLVSEIMSSNAGELFFFFWVSGNRLSCAYPIPLLLETVNLWLVG